MTNYGLNYRLKFQSKKKVCYEIQIEQKDYTGGVTDLTGSRTVVTVSVNDDDFIYSPLRLSTAKIKVVGTSYLQSIFATSYQQYRVTLLKYGNSYNNTASIEWCGYIKPETYTQDYVTKTFELDLECVSLIESLDKVSYKSQGTDGKIFVTFKSIMSAALSVACGRYDSLYIAPVMMDDDKTTPAIISSNFMISEQNFFDEEDKAMSYKEVLEELCRINQLTLTEYSGMLVLSDKDYTGDYQKWIISSDGFTYDGLKSQKVVNVQGIGFAGNNHALDILGGYNKASIKTSNYNNVSSVFPTESFDDLQDKSDISLENGNYKMRRKLKIPSVWKAHYYEGTGYTADGHSTYENNINYWPDYTRVIEEANEVDSPKPYKYYNQSDGLNYGAYLAQYFSWLKSDTDIINYSYEDIILLHKVMYYGVPFDHRSVAFNPTNGFLNYSSKLPVALYADGAISISLSALPATTNYNMLYWESVTSNTLIVSVITFTFMLRIGDYYYNGTSWVQERATFTISTENFSESEQNTFKSLLTNKTLAMPYNGMTGYIIPLPSTPLAGELYFAIMDVSNNAAVKDLKLSFQLEDGYVKDNNTDRVYENVVNDNFVNEMDQIEEKISSYHNEGICFSKVFKNGNTYLTDNLYCALTAANVRPEEYLLRRIINQYEAPKIKLTQVLMYDGTILPIDRLTDLAMVGKSFIPTGAEIDYAADSVELKMIEKA